MRPPPYHVAAGIFVLVAIVGLVALACQLCSRLLPD